MLPLSAKADARLKLAAKELMKTELYPLLLVAVSYLGYQRIQIQLQYIAQMWKLIEVLQNWMHLVVFPCKQ